MIDLTSSLPRDTRVSKVLQHVAHPMSSTHALIVQTSTKKSDEQLHVLALDLNFIPQTSPYYLSTLATKSTQLLNLLRYLMQISLHLSIELRGAFDLPSKFIRNINDTLAQSSDGPIDFVTATYQLVVTGECSDELRDWMIDEIGERNLKRWEKASMFGMETIRRLVHECLLPAIERCQVVLSRLEGLSRFGKSAEVLGLETQSLNRVMDTVDCLNLLGHHLLKTVSQEIRQFSAFIRWLRLEVEIQGIEKENTGGPGSERLDEICMRRDEIESRTVLDYIEGVMGKSGMVAFLRPSVDARGSSLDGPAYDWSENQVDAGFYEVFKKMLKKTSEPGKRPALDGLLRRLKGQAEKVFDGIAQTLGKSILNRRICTLRSDCDSHVSPARMVVKGNGDGFVVVLATRQKSAATKMNLYHISFEAANRGQKYEARELTTSGGQTIVDMKFVDDTELMVLSTSQDSAHLYTLNYTSAEPGWQERHTFDLSGGRSAPSELDVNGRNGRRAACVLEDAIKFTVFDLDSERPDDEMPAEDEDVVME
jgi:anaphase-promoting complex subunit 4